MLHMQHHFLCNISYVVIAESMGKSLKYTTNIHTYIHTKVQRFSVTWGSLREVPGKAPDMRYLSYRACTIVHIRVRIRRARIRTWPPGLAPGLCMCMWRACHPVSGILMRPWPVLANCAVNLFGLGAIKVKQPPGQNHPHPNFGVSSVSAKGWLEIVRSPRVERGTSKSYPLMG